MPLRRILPEPGDVEPAELVGSLDLGALAPAGRPYLIANMVATADGRAAVSGRSGPIASDADRELFHALRTLPDAILVGSNTLAIERYGRFVGDEDRRAARVAAGRAGQPLGCIVSRSLRLPLDIPLFEDPDSTVVVYTSSEAPLPPCSATVHVVRLEAAELTLTSALEHLRADHGVRSVLCEGGPTILGALLAEELVDELFLTLAPKLSGGGRAPSTTEGVELAEPARLELVWALEAEGYLFLRYATRR